MVKQDCFFSKAIYIYSCFSVAVQWATFFYSWKEMKQYFLITFWSPRMKNVLLAALPMSSYSASQDDDPEYILIHRYKLTRVTHLQAKYCLDAPPMIRYSLVGYLQCLIVVLHKENVSSWRTLFYLPLYVKYFIYMLSILVLDLELKYFYLKIFILF